MSALLVMAPDNLSFMPAAIPVTNRWGYTGLAAAGPRFSRQLVAAATAVVAQ